ARGRRGRGARDEGIVGVQILLGEFATERVRRSPAGRDVGVLAEDQRLKTTFLGGRGYFGGPHAVIRGEVAQTEFHRKQSPRNTRNKRRGRVGPARLTERDARTMGTWLVQAEKCLPPGLKAPLREPRR